MNTNNIILNTDSYKSSHYLHGNSSLIFKEAIKSKIARWEDY